MLERVAGSTARWPSHGDLGDEAVDDREIGVGARDQRIEPADRLGPAERVEIVFDAQHRRRVDGLALEDAFDELAARGQAEDLRQRPGRLVGFEPFDGARRQDQHAMRALAAQHLLPGEGDDIELGEIEPLRERRRGGVADRQPARGRPG